MSMALVRWRAVDLGHFFLTPDGKVYPTLRGGKGNTYVAPPPTPPVPAMTPEQTETQQLSLRMAKQQQADYDATRAAFERETGLPFGEYQGQQAKAQADITSAIQKRFAAAAKGEAPVDPALEDKLQREERETRERLQAQLGPGWEVSTAGTQAMKEFNTYADSLRYQAQHGELTAAEQLGYANPAAATPGALLTGQYGTAMGGLGSMYNQYQQNRGLELGQANLGYNASLQAMIANAQNAAAQRAGLYGMGGQIIGTGAGVGVGILGLRGLI